MQKPCPKCSGELAAAKGAYKCTHCSGLFVPAPLVPFVEEEEGSPGAAGDAQGGRCPFDGTILSRAEVPMVSGNQRVHLERCSSCRGIWFDRGEWSLLAEQQLLEHLDQFWTAEWRAKQRRLHNEREYERRQQEEFGPELFASLQSVAKALKGHERRSQALAYIREASAD